MKGRLIDLKAGSDTGHGYLSESEASRGGVLVLHAWWGLNDFFKGFCDQLANEGFTALAPDLRQGKVAKTVDEAKQLMETIDEMKGFRA